MNKPKPSYNHLSHTHCWDNKDNPCGIPIEKHKQCCLCDLKCVPEKNEQMPTPDKECDCVCHTIKVYKRGEAFERQYDRPVSCEHCSRHMPKKWEAEFDGKFGDVFDEYDMEYGDYGVLKKEGAFREQVISFIRQLREEDMKKIKSMERKYDPETSEVLFIDPTAVEGWNAAIDAIIKEHYGL